MEDLLTGRGIAFTVYNYPTPEKGEHLPVMQRYGEEPGGIVLAYFDLFLNIFHAHSEAAIVMNDTEHFDYMERVIHTMFNPRHYTRGEEGILSWCCVFRLTEVFFFFFFLPFF
jgi:hypothetical protein